MRRPAHRVDATPTHLPRHAQSDDRPARLDAEPPGVELDVARAPKLRGHAGSTSDGHARSDPGARRRLELRCGDDLEHEAGERTARGDGEVDRGALFGEDETLRPGDRSGRARS